MYSSEHSLRCDSCHDVIGTPSFFEDGNIIARNKNKPDMHFCNLGCMFAFQNKTGESPGDIKEVVVVNVQNQTQQG